MGRAIDREEAAVERQATLLAPLTQLHSLRWSHRWPPHGLSRHDAHVLLPLPLPPLPPSLECLDLLTRALPVGINFTGPLPCWV